MSARILAFALFAALLAPALPARADTASDIAALQAAVASLQQKVASQQAQINALKSVTSGFSRVTDTTRTDGKNGTELYLTGFNLHVVNGLGATNGEPNSPRDVSHPVVNGLGNLIVGYNVRRGDDEDLRIGSHNIVVGDGAGYLSFGGLVAGQFNTVSAPYATVTGGAANTASQRFTSVSGGFGNLASGSYSTVSGGGGNAAAFYGSSVTSGANNVANAYYASVTGGNSNTASGVFSSVSGGQNLVEDAQYGWAASGYHTP